MQFETDLFPVNEIYYMRSRMIKLGIRKNNFLNESQINIIRELYNSKKLIISLVRHNNKVQAISFILKNNHKYLFWIDMFDDSKMINLFNYISYMREVSVNESVIVNFGRGTYNYKIVNFKPTIKQLYTILVFENRMQLYLSQFSDKILKTAKLIYRKIVK